MGFLPQYLPQLQMGLVPSPSLSPVLGLGAVDVTAGLCWEPLSSRTMPEGLRSGRLLSNWVYCCFTAFQKVISFQKAAWSSTPHGPGSKLVSAQPPQTVPSPAGVTAHLHIAWMSSSKPPQPARAVHAVSLAGQVAVCTGRVHLAAT